MPAEWPKLLRAVCASLLVADLLYGPGSGMGQYQARALADRRVAVAPARVGAQARSACSKRCKSIQCGPTLHRSRPLTITKLQRTL
jgi:hypothetical protein